MRNLIYVFAVLALISCNTAKRLERKKQKEVEQNVVADANYRFSVSFISKGSGTDSKAKKAFDVYLNDFNSKNMAKVAYESSKWGREGEMDYCFKLSELKAKQQETFISGMKEALKDSDLVLFYENEPCKPGK